MAYLLKKKGFNDVTILEKTNRVGGMIDSVVVRGTKSTWHLWSWYMYRKTLIPLLTEFEFQTRMVNFTRDNYQFWPLNDYSVSLIVPTLILVSSFSRFLLMTHIIVRGIR